MTSNDSRVRLYDLKDHSLSCKYRGYANASSQIKASFSPDGEHIIVGSEDHDFYVWTREPEGAHRKGWRRDRNDDYQLFSAHNAVVTVAMFAPRQIEAGEATRSNERQLILTSDYEGAIRVYEDVQQRRGSVARRP